jgi:hypothetical protein
VSDEKTVPSVGRSVHYLARTVRLGEVCRAAIITEIDTDGSDRVGLAVFLPTETMYPKGVDRGDKPGTWHFPEIA